MMAGSTTVGEIGVTTKAEIELPNKDDEAVAGTTAMVTEESWIDYVILYKPAQALLLAPKQGADEPPPPPMEAMMITKERVPDSFIDILTKRRPFKRRPPLSDAHSNIFSKYIPEQLELWLIGMARRNCCIDLHEDVLRQHAEKGFAKVGVDFTGGVKKIFVLPQLPEQ